tara:strand:- start:13 stop:936 length:924 start_codon:yes stop_codon:yes gene_type:complete
MSVSIMQDKKVPSIGNFYNSEIRNNGTARRITEAMCRMDFQDHGFKRYNRPPYKDFGKHDLNLFIDDGRDDIEWLPDSPNACWLVDTHLGYDQRLKWAMHFDNVFLAQKDDVAKMNYDGVKNVHWLPLACNSYLDPSYKEMQANIKGDIDLTRSYDCCFVGFLNEGVEGDSNSHNRIDFLDYVFNAFPNSWLAFNLFFIDCAVRYNKAKVGLNVSIKNDLNMRFFEALSYGVCQLANTDMVGWEELGFVEGEHFLGYSSLEEAVEKIQWALENPKEREKIAKEGHELVRSAHTYEHRINEMLNIVGV